MNDWEKRNFDKRLGHYHNWIVFFVIVSIILGIVCVSLNQRLQDERTLSDFYKDSYEYYYQLYNNYDG